MAEKIVVTGATSYIGRSVVERLARSQAVEITALCSPRAGDNNFAAHPRIRRINISLAEPLPAYVAEALRSADRVLHFAWDRRGDATGSMQTNAAMIDNLLAACRPDAFVFISSVAGAPDAVSAYGRHKHALAERVRAAGGSVFVPGLVVEDPPAGPYAILTKAVSKLPLALRLSNKAPQVYPIGMDHLLQLIDRLADPRLPSGTWRGFDEPVAFNDFLRGIEARHPRARLPVRVPTNLLLFAARTLKRLPLPTRAYCDKILTFLHKNDAYLARTSQLPAQLDSAQPMRVTP